MRSRLRDGRQLLGRRREGGVAGHELRQESRNTLDAGIHRNRTRKQLVEDHAQGVDVRTGVHVEVGPLGLLRTHVRQGADGDTHAGEGWEVAQVPPRGFGDAEVDDLRHRVAVLLRHQDVRGFEVAVDDSFLMGVLHRLAELDEELDALAMHQAEPVAVLVDAETPHQLHHEVRSAVVGDPGVQDLGDARMIHHREGLSLGFESRDHLAGVRARLHHLEGDATAHRLELLRGVHDAHAPLAEELDEVVGADHLPFGGVGRGILVFGHGDPSVRGLNRSRGVEHAGRTGVRPPPVPDSTVGRGHRSFKHDRPGSGHRCPGARPREAREACAPILSACLVTLSPARAASAANGVAGAACSWCSSACRPLPGSDRPAPVDDLLERH